MKERNRQQVQYDGHVHQCSGCQSRQSARLEWHAYQKLYWGWMTDLTVSRLPESLYMAGIIFQAGTLWLWYGVLQQCQQRSLSGCWLLVPGQSVKFDTIGLAEPETGDPTQEGVRQL